jgi:hypothetical protein
MFKKNQIKLSGVIDTNIQPTEIRIKPTTGDAWEDFGHWLEAINFMAYQAMLQQGMTKEEMIRYISKYLDEALEDINVKN